MVYLNSSSQKSFCLKIFISAVRRQKSFLSEDIVVISQQKISGNLFGVSCGFVHDEGSMHSDVKHANGFIFIGWFSPAAIICQSVLCYGPVTHTHLERDHFIC